MPWIHGRYYMNPFFGRALEHARATEEAQPWSEEENGFEVQPLPNPRVDDQEYELLSAQSGTGAQRARPAGGRPGPRREPLYGWSRGKTTYIIYKDGSLEKRTGTRAWRNNNPGDIEYHPGVMREGQIGHDPRFIIFGSSHEGFNALSKVLSGRSYASLTVDEAVARFAPPNENDTKQYQRMVHAAGVPGEARIGSLKNSEKDALVKAIAKIEGFDRTGKEEFPKFP